MSATREYVVAAARRWIGTPYRHQASVRGAGTDCLGLVRGVWREVMGEEPERAPAYTPDWAEALGEEALLCAARRHLREIAIGDAAPGDVLLFRMGLGSPAKHAGIVSAVGLPGGGRIIHAYWGRGVCETRLVPWWERRIAAAFTWLGVSGAGSDREYGAADMQAVGAVEVERQRRYEDGPEHAGQ